jgi:hypothetical protein
MTFREGPAPSSKDRNGRSSLPNVVLLNMGLAYPLRPLESMGISRADLAATVAPWICRRDRAREDSDSRG